MKKFFVLLILIVFCGINLFSGQIITEKFKFTYPDSWYLEPARNAKIDMYFLYAPNELMYVAVTVIPLTPEISNCIKLEKYYVDNFLKPEFKEDRIIEIKPLGNLNSFFQTSCLIYYAEGKEDNKGYNFHCYYIIGDEDAYVLRLTRLTGVPESIYNEGLDIIYSFDKVSK